MLTARKFWANHPIPALMSASCRCRVVNHASTVRLVSAVAAAAVVVAHEHTSNNRPTFISSLACLSVVSVGADRPRDHRDVAALFRLFLLFIVLFHPAQAQQPLPASRERPPRPPPAARARARARRRPPRPPPAATRPRQAPRTPYARAVTRGRGRRDASKRGARRYQSDKGSEVPSAGTLVFRILAEADHVISAGCLP